MDLVQYYAKYGRKVISSTGETAQQQSSSSSPPDAIADSDIEEDDSKEIPRAELVAFIKELRSTNKQAWIKPHILLFNKTRQVECAVCMAANKECRLATMDAMRCELCVVRKRTCSRAEVFNRWMVRHKFCLSWQKSDEVLKNGLLEYQNARAAAAVPDDSRDKAGTGAPASDASPESRTSLRTPVPRVRKAPAGISTTIADPVLGRGDRPNKRAAPPASGPPRAERKRRKMAAEVSPTPASASTPAARPGREIIPARVVLRVPGANKSEAVPGSESRALRKGGVSVPADDADLSARVAATEARLDAIEERLQMPREPSLLEHSARQRVVAELGRAIAELESDGDGVQNATARLRVLQASLLPDLRPDDTEDGLATGHA
ncbi:hypothetical protein GGX14DRAFT_462652 [Mycena pura]|uniref:Uncharacterized protein n=1 Tax=Mycena pura TaxID=153505 RepID=A0AAD6Y721_9AGAR|nr:hypothetical protein GGX14DRAFT_462652 [Mycena pura]